MAILQGEIVTEQFTGLTPFWGFKYPSSFTHSLIVEVFQ